MSLISSLFFLRFISILHPNKNKLFDLIKRDHGRSTLRETFTFLEINKKLSKCDLDLQFLKTCKTYDVVPKFLRFKLYRRSLQNQNFYKSWQTHLLNEEIKFKKTRQVELQSALKNKRQVLYDSLSFVKYVWLISEAKLSISRFTESLKTVHSRKLGRLGIHGPIQPCDPEKVIFNLSSKPLPKRIKTLLAFGLDFKLPIWNLKFHNYFLCFEKVVQSIINLPLPPRFTIQDVKQKIRTLSYKTFHGFRSSKVFSSVFSKADVKRLRDFAADSSLVVTKPDKGKGVVVLDRDEYVRKVSDVLSDQSKFCIIKEPIRKVLRQVEDKVNRLLTKLKISLIISDETYKSLHVSGSTPGILYGLPKIHKPNVPLRPIFAACGTPVYKLAQYLVPILAPLTVNEFTIKNSYQFVQDLRDIKLKPGMILASFDVESLFTNIPVQETIDITINSLFKNCSHVSGIPKQIFYSILEMAVKSSYFLFNGQLFKQKDGVGMGLPLGPSFANIFLCHHETRWLKNCPPEFRPKYFRRFLDDTFAIFEKETHVTQFLDYLNGQHPKIKFTKEVEKDGCLPFLDIRIQRSGTNIDTSVYRKPSFTGLGTSFFSFIPFVIKSSIVKSAVFRAYMINSSFKNFDCELSFLKKFFCSNGFPLHMINTTIKSFLDKRYSNPEQKFSVPKLVKYFVLPYFGKQSLAMQKEFITILTKFYPYLDPKVVLKNNFTIGSLFRFKDVIPKHCRSGVVYKYSCASCQASYVGSTQRSLISRVRQHQGISERTEKMLANPDCSAIRDHSFECDTPITLDQFMMFYYNI